ncbi:L-aminoadipate-semialdehyde dehydrogenase-phosphopantetheinyl transferase-like [Mytilus trossulus]|uniref:L-aminoadipate-semialdehyde dehydrogenase-phosphopantetheinyl transferase-like n=1 Tax=Mytilus trossulus TaxID=6551 RepID=UPI0030049079
MRKVMAHVRWAFNFTAWTPGQTEWTFCNQCIQKEERERIKKFYFTKDAKAAMIGRLLIRNLVAEYTDIPYKDIQLSRTEKGRPYVLNRSLPFDFNVSHQGDYAVIGAESDTIIGTDVMKLEPPRSSGVGKFFDTMNRQFSKDEWKIIKSPAMETDQLKLFFRHWCLKESYVKALGIGIGFEIHRLNFKLNTLNLPSDRPLTNTTLKVDEKEEKDWIFEEHLLDDHCMAVAYKKAHDDQIEASKNFSILDYQTIIQGAVPLCDPEEQYWNDFCDKPKNPELLKKSNKS